MFERDWKDLSDREERQKTRRRLPLILLIVLLMVAIGGGSLLAWQALSQQSSSANGGSSVAPAQATQGTQGTQATGIDPQDKRTPSDVAAEVRQNVAHKLHLSVSQLQAKLQTAAPGTEIETLATQQGMSLEQWRSFVLDTYQAAYAHAVHAGKVNNSRANHDLQNIRSYPLVALDDWVAQDCLGASAQ